MLFLSANPSIISGHLRWLYIFFFCCLVVGGANCLFIWVSIVEKIVWLSEMAVFPIGT